jgi:hypothetical protein
MATVDVLMVTFDRPDYTRRSLQRLIDAANESDDRVRVWLWHNGTDEQTLSVARDFANHPTVDRFHHSEENKRLWAPTNWLWGQSDADYVAKVDDDCLVEDGWTDKLVAAHQGWNGFGILGCWRFQDEDFVTELSEPKICEFPGGHRILQSLWVQGSSYILPRRHVDDHGTLKEGQSFTQYCKQLAVAGLINGWYFPFIHEDHMDDPRSPNTGLLTDADLLRRLPLSAQRNGVRTLHEWEDSIRRSALVAQSAPLEPNRYRGWRKVSRNAARRAKRLVSGRDW